jgi:hypothetical protein
MPDAVITPHQLIRRVPLTWFARAKASAKSKAPFPPQPGPQEKGIAFDRTNKASGRKFFPSSGRETSRPECG